MGFIEGIPKSSGFDCFMVVVGRLSKYAHFIPLSHHFSALTAAQAYICDAYKLHGMPKSVVCDREMIFTDTFWKELFRIIDTKLDFNTPYHPETGK